VPVSVGGLARAAVNSLPGVNLGPGAGDLPSASLADNLAFNSLVVVPNALQGLFRRRPAAVRAATRANVDRWAVRLLRGMRRTHRGSPVWVRLGTAPALLLLDVADVRTALEGSPDPFASDPEAKRKGMSHFQPDALTISRDGPWESRRRFAEAVLATAEPVHPLADRFAAVVAEEVAALLAGAGAELGWEPWAAALRRITRRIVLGDGARDDEELSELLATLMDEANSLPDSESESFAPYIEKIKRYVEAAEEGSLVGWFADAPADAETRPARQVTHWLFAMGDTLAINAFRALAVIASHPEALRRVESELAAAGSNRDAAAIAGLEFLGACLEEAMRLWPTTPLLSRETVRETDWRGVAVAKGAQFVIVNAYMHRDPDRHDFADRLAPEAWLEGDAGDDWAYNHLSHGPQGCPGAGLALFVGKAALAEVLGDHRVELIEPPIDPTKPLPHMLDFFSIRLRASIREST
jgi:cytochrome P450